MNVLSLVHNYYIMVIIINSLLINYFKSQQYKRINIFNNVKIRGTLILKPSFNFKFQTISMGFKTIALSVVYKYVTPKEF